MISLGVVDTIYYRDNAGVCMVKFEEHEARAKTNSLFRPIMQILDKLAKRSDEVLVEFDKDKLDSESLSAFMADFSDLEYIYDELMDKLGSTLQDIPSESRIAKDTLRLLQTIKEIFEDIRIKADSIEGFLKPSVPKNVNILDELIAQLNDAIKRLREMLSIKIREHIQNLISEYIKFEGFLSESIDIEE